MAEQNLEQKMKLGKLGNPKRTKSGCAGGNITFYELGKAVLETVGPTTYLSRYDAASAIPKSARWRSQTAIEKEQERYTHLEVLIPVSMRTENGVEYLTFQHSYLPREWVKQ